MFKRNVFAVVLAFVLAFQGLLFPADAAAKKIKWGEVKEGVYSPLHPFTLLWSGDVLQSGGLNLTTMKITKKASEADIVMNQYGDMGAAGILELDEELTDPTDIDLADYTNSVEMEQNKVYLVVLHDGSFAKIRIDRLLLPTKVYFSYVLEETGAEDEPQPQPQPEPSDEITTFTFTEGDAIEISWEAAPGDVDYEIYRSDNGADYVMLTDFSLTETSFVDKYALGGHVYYYLVYAYDANNNYRQIGPIRVIVNSKSDAPVNDDNKSVIILQLNNKTAKVNGVAKSLDVPPFTLDGRTMVPIRFVGEALGAKINWDQAAQKVTLTLQGTTVELWIDKSEARVNGKKVFMDVPAKIMKGRTMVPIRFVSESFNQEVSFDNATSTITITGKRVNQQQNGGETSSNQTSGQDVSVFYGKWSLWTPGGNYQGQYSPGADSGVLVINKDGTFTRELGNSVIEGEWKMTGTDNQIMLIKGDYGWDWKVTYQDDGSIYVSTFGVYMIGTNPN